MEDSDTYIPTPQRPRKTFLRTEKNDKIGNPPDVTNTAATLQKTKQNHKQNTINKPKNFRRDTTECWSVCRVQDPSFKHPQRQEDGTPVRVPTVETLVKPLGTVTTQSGIAGSSGPAGVM